MPKYQFVVAESRTVEVLYTVEAGTEEEARSKAEIGDTVEEEEVNGTSYSVISREVIEEVPVEVSISRRQRAVFEAAFEAYSFAPWGVESTGGIEVTREGGEDVWRLLIFVTASTDEGEPTLRGTFTVWFPVGSEAPRDVGALVNGEEVGELPTGVDGSRAHALASLAAK